MSLARLNHMSIPEPITEAKGWNVLIGWTGSLTHPRTSHRGHLGRTLPFEGLDIVPFSRCSDMVAIISSHPSGSREHLHPI